MSGELRATINGLVSVSKKLAENGGGNLPDEQVRFAQTVYRSGNALLQLINEILDLSRVEAGEMPIDPRPCVLAEGRDYIEQTFRHVAEMKTLRLEVHMDPGVPATMYTDPTRLQQILKNLLSNAFKFTAKGKVSLIVKPSNLHDQAISFAIEDTGIGIPLDKQRLIFEAFQQADGTTSRKYGGTGLGLTISRELARLL